MMCTLLERGSTLRVAAKGFALAGALALLALPLEARTNGLVSSDQGNRPLQFDSTSPTGVTGTALTIAGGVGDCAIQPDQGLGFLANGTSNITALDLDGSAPAPATGISPIAASFQVDDLAVSADGKFLAACGAGSTSTAGLAIYDLDNNQAEFLAPVGNAGCRGVAFCGRNLIYAYGSGSSTTLLRHTVSDAGVFAIAASRGFTDRIVDVLCGANDDQPIVLIGGNDPQILPLRDDLTSAGVRRITGESPISGAVYRPEGEDPYLAIRLSTGTASQDQVRMYRLDPATNNFRAGGSVWNQTVASSAATPGNGIDLLDVDPRDGRVFASSAGGVSSFAIANGAAGPVITPPRGQLGLTGICIAPQEIYIEGDFESGGIGEWSGFVSDAS